MQNTHEYPPLLAEFYHSFLFWNLLNCEILTVFNHGRHFYTTYYILYWRLMLRVWNATTICLLDVVFWKWFFGPILSFWDNQHPQKWKLHQTNSEQSVCHLLHYVHAFRWTERFSMQIVSMRCINNLIAVSKHSRLDWFRMPLMPALRYVEVGMRNEVRVERRPYEV